MTEKRVRFQELDGLRGIAAVAVVFYHFGLSYNAFYPDDGNPLIDLWWGEYGVQLFFLISGFVILMTAQRARRKSDFVISRVSRLYPVYWIAVTVATVLSLAFVVPKTQIPWLDRVMNYTMVQRQLLFANVDQVYWTLAVEMQFYILVFIVLVLTRNHLTDRLAVILAVAWTLLCLAVAIVVRPHTVGIAPQLVDTPIKMAVNLVMVEYGPLFSAGMIAYVARQDSRYRPLAVAALIIAPVVTLVLRGAEIFIPVAVVALIFAVVVFRTETRVLRLRPIQFYGRISYSLYVSHCMIGIVILHHLVPLLGRNWSVLVTVIAVTLVAVVYHEIGENRGTRALKRLLVAARERLLPARHSAVQR